MSAAAKTRHTEVVIGKRNPKRYLLPVHEATKIKKLFSPYLVTEKDDEDEKLIDANEFFDTLFTDTPKASVLISGYRHRDELTQAQLAKKLGTTQSAVSAMEKGTRPIGKQVAKKLAKLFDTDYRAFL